MPFFEFDNKKVWYKIIGKGKPVLFLHSNTVSSKMFNPVKKLFKKRYRMILVDLPGHGKSDRMEGFNADYWYYNSLACAALIDHLKIEKLYVIGTGGGAIAGLNLALEFPKKVAYLIADSFEGEYPQEHYIKRLENDRKIGKMRFMNRLFWFVNHGSDWEKVVDADTRMLLDFYATGKSFFHKPLSQLYVPTLLTGSRQDNVCRNLADVYGEIKLKNKDIEVAMYSRGPHPAMLSNKQRFFALAQTKFL